MRLHLFFASITVPLVAAGGLLPAQSQEPVFPGEGWERVRGGQLEEYGWSQAGLRSAQAHLRDSSNTTGLVVVDRGRTVFQFGDIVELSYVASVRKSILSILYGKYVADGTIDLSKTIEEMGLDDVGGLLDIEKQATIRAPASTHVSSLELQGEPKSSHLSHRSRQVMLPPSATIFPMTSRSSLA